MWHDHAHLQARSRRSGTTSLRCRRRCRRLAAWLLTPGHPSWLCIQEADYIRQEARQQFRANRLDASSEAAAQAVRNPGRPPPVLCACAAAATSVRQYLDVGFTRQRDALHLNCPQLEEGEKRLELALHYGIAYPRLHHADQFARASAVPSWRR